MKNAKKFGAFAAVVAAMVCVHTANAVVWNGRTNIVEDVQGGVCIDFAYSSDTIVRQTAHTVDLGPQSSVFGNNQHNVAYLLEGGLLKKTGGASLYMYYEAYRQIRQTGGDIKFKEFNLVQPSQIRADFVFGGNGTADLGSIDYMSLRGDALMAFQDSVYFTTSLNDYKYVAVNPLTHRIWAYNGGVADYCLNGNGTLTPNCPTNDFFAFNGGKRWFRFANDSAGTDFVFGHKPDVRIYEKGGEVCMRANNTWNISYNFLEPEGGVVKSVALTPEAMSNIVDGVAQFWDVVPAVEIYDEDGVGTNAAAVVDYDYDTRTITNITVVCGGEKYSNSAKAQFIAYRDGVVTRLLETALDCEVVTGVKGGDFTFAATNIGARINLRAHTNNLHGALIVDMDRSKLADGGLDTSLWGNTLFIEYYGTSSGYHKPRFPNCTAVIIKSGCATLSSSWGWNHQTSVGFLPNCYILEMYGGHIGGGTFTATNFVVGGTAYLTGHRLTHQQNNSSPYYCDVNVSSYAVGSGNAHPGWKTQKVPNDPGTLTVDVDSTTAEDGTHTPAMLLGGGENGMIYDDAGYPSTSPSFDPTTAHKVNNGVVRFGGTPANPCTMTIRNYESLRKTHGRKLLLDLSSDSISVFGPTNVIAVTPPDIEPLGKLQWIAEEKKLYWNSADGMMLIFR